MSKSILATINLTDQESVKNMWDTLRAVKKDYYAPDERIIVIYSKQNNPLLVKSLNEILLDLDIPEFFISYQELDIPVDDSYSFYLNDNFCFYPWTNIRFEPNGTSATCCNHLDKLKDTDNKTYNVNHNEIKEIYFSKSMSELRETFRTGNWDTKCNPCRLDEESGLLSLRNQTKISFHDIFHTIDYQNNSIDNLKILDLNLGNECNLSCRICNPGFSSSIGKEQNSMLNIQDDTLITASDKYYNNLLEVSKHIRHLSIQGGEPLMSKKHFDYLKKLIELGYSKNIKIDYATNGTLYSDKFLRIWDEFKEVTLSFSIDDLGERFEYQRNGANWNTVEDNIKKYCTNKSNKLKLNVFPTVNIQNVYYLPELIDWINDQSLPYSLSVLRHPEYLSIENLDDAVKEKICQKLDNFNSYKDLSGIIYILKNSPDQIDKGFVSYMKNLDQFRNQSFTNTHNEIAQIINFN
jgi:molybdenum cofactor biosynthesis enzyme MoaA